MNGLVRPDAYQDREDVWQREHYRRRCISVVPLATNDVIAEHKANPRALGTMHSLELQRLNRLLSSYPADRVMFRLCRFDDTALWRIAAFRPGGQMEILHDRCSEDVDELLHEIFLMRLEAARKVATEAEQQ